MGEVVTRLGSALRKSSSGWPVVCGFLILCRKDFTSPGDFESPLIKAGESETKEGFRVEDIVGKSLGGTLLWLPRKVIGKE